MTNFSPCIAFNMHKNNCHQKFCIKQKTRKKTWIPTMSWHEWYPYYKSTGIGDLYTTKTAGIGAVYTDYLSMRLVHIENSWSSEFYFQDRTSQLFSWHHLQREYIVSVLLLMTLWIFQNKSILIFLFYIFLF